MAEVVMPRLSDTMEEGVLSRWLKNVGDQVAKGDVLAEIETDKATMDLEAFDSGVLEQQVVEEGTTVPIGEVLAIVGDGSGASGGGAGAAGGEGAGGGAEGAGGAKSAEDAEGAAGAGGESAQGESAQGEPAQGEPAQGVRAEGEPAQGERAGGGEPESGVGGAGAGGPGVGNAPAQGAGTAAAAEDEAASAGRESAAGGAQAEPASGGGAKGGDIRVSPLARKIARDNGIDLTAITGSGPGGRIVRADIEDAVAAKGAGGAEAEERQGGQAAGGGAAQQGQGQTAGAQDGQAQGAGAELAPGDERVPLNNIRRITAKRLTESQAVPHFFLTNVVDVEKLLALRAQINEELADFGVKVSVNDLIVRAAAVTLRAHPEVNSSWAGDSLTRHARVNVGIAVALESGLIVPVIPDADRKSLSEISAQAQALADKARQGKLKPDEFSGGTFTISNLGMFGIHEFTAVINPPEAAILAVGAASPQPVLRDGELVNVRKMKITLTVDHRVLDGATAAAFLRDLTKILEEPLRIVV